jgi:hypothetical protein
MALWSLRHADYVTAHYNPSLEVGTISLDSHRLDCTLCLIILETLEPERENNDPYSIADTLQMASNLYLYVLFNREKK